MIKGKSLSTGFAFALACGALVFGAFACGSSNDGADTDAGVTPDTGSGPADTSVPPLKDASVAIDATPQENLLAGAAKHDMTPATGVPLGGYGARRSGNVDTDPTNYVTFFKASTGVRDPLYCKALVLDNGTTEVAMLSLDAVAIANDVAGRIVERARQLGLHAKPDDVMLFASHTHSGLGDVSGLHFWEQAALDLYVARVADGLVESCALALAEADRNRAPARIGVSEGAIDFATTNRRAGTSPTSKPDSIDPQVFTIRVDTRKGEPIATLWNFAIHGTALGEDNLRFSADIMGEVGRVMEESKMGIALFANSAEGDISSRAGGEAEMVAMAPRMVEQISAARNQAVMTGVVDLASSSKVVPFGHAQFHVSPNNVGGQLDLSAVSLLFPNGTTQSLGPDWVDNDFRYQAIRINNDIIVSVPGEPIREVGTLLKNAGKAAGYDHSMVFGLANGHMSYITTEPEYNAGGYEALLTLWGSKEADLVIAACKGRIAAVKK